MKTRSDRLVVLAVALLVAAPYAGVCKPVHRPARVRVKHADRNKDGRVSAKELKAEKKFIQKKRAEVNTPREEKMDKNNDGVVQAREAHAAKTKAYLKNASDVDRKWEAKADANGDGKVDAKELRSHHLTVMDRNGDGSIDSTERKTFWATRKAKVNTKIEAKYDADENGFINGEEAREMLRDRLRVINTHGRAKVNSAIEREYDADGDGIIDREEAKAIRDAIGD